MRWRRMFYLTGLPGWLRFGFSPGWGALPPGAAYIFGRYPGPWAWGAFPPGAPYPFTGGYPGAWIGSTWTKAEEIQWLSAQAEALEEELQAIKERLDELTKEKG